MVDDRSPAHKGGAVPPRGATGTSLAILLNAGRTTSHKREDIIVSEHQVWQHAATNEIWAVRLDRDVLTGVFGPIACTPSAEVLPALPYEDQSDDLDWVSRSADDFRQLD